MVSYHTGKTHSITFSKIYSDTQPPVGTQAPGYAMTVSREGVSGTASLWWKSICSFIGATRVSGLGIQTKVPGLWPQCQSALILCVTPSHELTRLMCRGIRVQWSHEADPTPILSQAVEDGQSLYYIPYTIGKGAAHACTVPVLKCLSTLRASC